MALHQIKVEFPASTADGLEGVLLDLGVAGWSLLEDAIAKRAWLVGIFPTASEADRRWVELRAILKVLPLRAPTVRRLPAADWRNSYKAHFRAWTCGRLHWVPEWERKTFWKPKGHAVLWLDPGLAFGTGNHETTRLCCQRLVALAEQTTRAQRAAARVIDAGCGSGILALSAALLGYGRIAGFDLDPVAVRISRVNAKANGLAGRVKFFAADLDAGLAGRPANLVLANIQADVLMGNAGALLAAVAPGGTLVLSGILALEREKVREMFTALAPGWRVQSRKLGEWCDVVLSRPLDL